MMSITTPGNYKMPFDVYLRDPAIVPSLSRSTIKDLLFSSPAHAWHNNPRLNPEYQEKENGKFDIGTSAHALLFEGSSSIAIIDAEDWRTKLAKEEREKAYTEGKTPLLAHQFIEVSNMVEVAKKKICECKELAVKDLSTDGEAELTYVWQEGDTWLRIRPDWISEDKKLCIDYKTVGGSANPETISKHIVSMGYALQASLYHRGIKAIEGIEPKFIFIFQETEEPYLCSFVGLSPEFMEMGRQQVEYGIFLWTQCMASGKWPAYPQRVCWVDAPPWALAQWEQIAANIGEENYEM